jgi:hypothetical protein
VLKIHESTASDGSLATVSLSVDCGSVLLIEANADGTHKRVDPLPEGALEAVMTRFGKALDPAARITCVATLELGNERLLRHVRHLARFDVIARDYLLYELPGSEPTCALAATVAAALGHLARARGPRSR